MLGTVLDHDGPSGELEVEDRPAKPFRLVRRDQTPGPSPLAPAPVTFHVPPIRAVADGMPDPEADEAVKSARAKLAGLTNQLAETREKLAEVRSRLPGGVNGGEAEIVEAIAEGANPADLALLEQLGTHERRLAAACHLAAGEIGPVLDAARRRCSQEARAAILVPKVKAAASAFLAFLETLAAMKDARDSIQFAGLDQGDDANYVLHPSDFATDFQNSTIDTLVARSLLAREQVTAALPGIRI